MKMARKRTMMRKVVSETSWEGTGEDDIIVDTVVNKGADKLILDPDTCS